MLINLLAETSQAQMAGDMAPAIVIVWVFGVAFAAAIVAAVSYMVVAFLKGRNKAGITVSPEEWADMKQAVKDLEALKKELDTLKRWRKAARKLATKAIEELRGGDKERALLALEFFVDLEDTHLEG